MQQCCLQAVHATAPISFNAAHSAICVNGKADSLGLMPGNNSSTGSDDNLNRLGSAIGAMSQSNVDQGPDVCPPESARLTGEHLGKRAAAFARTRTPPTDI